MPIDPAYPPATSPDAALAQRLADLERRLTAVERGGSSMAGYAEDLAIKSGVVAATDTPAVSLRIGPAGGLVFAYFQCDISNTGAFLTSAHLNVYQSDGVTLAVPNDSPWLTTVVGAPGSYITLASAPGKNLNPSTDGPSVPVGQGGPCCLGYLPAGLYIVKPFYTAISGGSGLWKNRRLAAWVI